VSAAPALYTPVFWIAWAVHLTGGTSLAMFVLLPLFVRALGGSDALSGLLLGVGAVASVAARPLVGNLLDRVGRRRILVGATALNVVSYLPFLTVDRIGPALWAYTLVHFVLWGALFATYFTYAADLAPPARRTEGIAIFGVAGLLSSGIGPALGEIVLDHGGYPGLFLVAAGFGLLSLGFVALLPKDGSRPHVEHASAGIAAHLGRTLAERGLLRVLGATFLFGVAINATSFFVAPWTRAVGVERAGPFFLAYAVTAAGLRVVGRRVLDRVGPHAVAIPAFAIFAFGLVVLGFLPAPGVLLLSGIACGTGHGTLFPVLNVLAITRAPPGVTGSAVGLYTGALDLGAVVGTPLCGALAETLGYPAMFGVVALGAVAGLVLLARDPGVARGRDAG
jgi:predicted MFS family arabinose efflux permease